MGLWLEIVTLLIPGFNDSTDELRRLTEFLASISPDIPWHVTAFHGDYKMQGEGQRDTTVEDLLRAAEIGQAAGLRYIYAGNLPGMVGPWEDTRCPQCRDDVDPQVRLSHRRLQLDAGRPLPELCEPNSRALGGTLRWPDHLSPFPSTQTPAFIYNHKSLILAVEGS